MSSLLHGDANRTIVIGSWKVNVAVIFRIQG